MKIRQPPIVEGYQMDVEEPLTQLAMKRMRMGRDLKIIVTAQDSETGTGKTTCASWYALGWNWMFAGNNWTAEKHATLNPMQYFDLQRNAPPGTVLVVDDAEELDARRSMQHMNVEFSHRWMLMRVRQIITIITLPSPAALDRRLEELADVWINVERRGQALCHDIRVQSYGSRKVMTKKVHRLEWPNIGGHDEVQNLAALKEDKIDGKLKSDDSEDEDEDLPKHIQIRLAQQWRDLGKSLEWIADEVDEITYSREWIRQNTVASGKEASA